MSSKASNAAVSAQPWREIEGPRAFVGGWRRFAYLTRIMASTEWKLRFFDSLLGYLWTLARPLFFFGVLYVVFSVIIDIGDDVPHYPVLLLAAMILYLSFVEGTTRALTSLVDNENLIRKIHFPLMAIPAAAVLLATFALALNGVALAVFLFVDGVEPKLSWLELPFLLIPLLILSVGVSAAFAALYVRARDLSPIWDVVTQALFYLTPILYPIQLVVDKAGEGVAQLLMINPLAAIIQQGRHALVGDSQPSAAEAIGGAPRLLVPMAIVAAAFALGVWVFTRVASQTAEDL